MTNLGMRIRERRMSLNLTIEKLAEKTDLSKNYIGDIERGKCYPRFEQMVKIVKVLCIDLNYLVQDYFQYMPIKEYDYYTMTVIDLMSVMTEEQKKIIMRHIEDVVDFSKKSESINIL